MKLSKNNLSKVMFNCQSTTWHFNFIDSLVYSMAIPVVEFSRGGYKIEETYLIIPKSIFKVNLEMKKNVSLCIERAMIRIKVI